MQQVHQVLHSHVPHALKIIAAFCILTACGVYAVFLKTDSVSADVTSIVLSYPLSEGVGTTTVDRSGSTHTGTLVNGPLWTTGKYGAGLSFDGSNDYVQTPHTTALNITGNQITLSAWVRPASLSSTRVIVGKPSSATKYTSPYYAYALTMVSGVPRLHLRLGSTTHTLNAASALTLNTWKHVTGTYDGTTMRIYIDGVLSASKAATGNVKSYTTPVRVGVNGALLQAWSGAMDDVRIYNRALSVGEIQSDMSASAGGTPAPDTTLPTVSITAPVANATVADTVNVTASASDNVAVLGVQFFVDGVATGVEDTTAPYTASWNTRTATNGVHTLSAQARDLAGNTASATIAVTVSNDLTPPSVPTNFEASNITHNSLSLAWTASTDNVGVSGYRVYKNGTLITTVTSTSYAVSALTASTAYTFGVVAIDAAGNTSGTSSVNATTMPAPQGTGIFPLSVAPDNKHMLDAQGNPFFIKGDTAWSLIAQLTLPEVRLYLDNRKEKGFNTIMVNLVEHEYADNPPLNANGDSPFTNTHNMSTTNEAYFAFVDQVMAEIEARDMLVLLFPAYVGCCGGDGWRLEMGETGETNMRTYGRYLGTRYGAYENIIWMMGGDGAPAGTIGEIRALVGGIEDTAGPQLFSVHNGRYQSGVTQYPANEPWIDINTTYSGCDDLSYLKTDAERTPTMPFFFIEGWYENEGGEGPIGCQRAQAYHPMLSGAFGFMFGNNPIWNFKGRPITPVSMSWQDALDYPGSVTMTHVHKLIDSRPWSLLEPDFAHTVVTSGYGIITEYDHVSAARASDGSTVVVYIPEARTFTVNMSAISGTQARAWWYNPDNGTATLIGLFATTGSQNFTTPSYGESVLVLDDAALGYGAPGTDTSTSTPTAPTLTFSGTPTSITAGQSATLTWSSTDSTSCTASGAWTGAKAVSGTTVVSPTSTSTYSLFCTGAGGNSTTKNVTITVTPVVVPVTPTLTFSGTPTSITAGQSATLTWSSTDSTSCTASGAWTGAKAVSGTSVVSPATTATYSLYCSGAGGNTATQNVVITVTPVSTTTPTTTGLIAAYNMNEGSGTVLTDRSGNGRNGTLVGTPTWEAGKNGLGLTFGSSDNVNFGSTLPLQGISKFTLSAWVKRDSANAKVEIGRQNTAGGDTVAIELWSSGYIDFGVSPSGSYTAGSAYSNDTNWHYVTMVFDGTQSSNANRLKGYIDGIQQTLSFDGTIPAVTSSGTTAFGIGYMNGSYSAGKVDDMRIYNRALTQTEIQADMVTPVP